MSVKMGSSGGVNINRIQQEVMVETLLHAPNTFLLIQATGVIAAASLSDSDCRADCQSWPLLLILKPNR